MKGELEIYHTTTFEVKKVRYRSNTLQVEVKKKKEEKS